VDQYQAILEHVPPAMLVVFRIGGLMIYGPVFGSSVIPVRVKVFLSFLLGIAVYPLLSSQLELGTGLRLELFALVPLVGVELLIGLLIGYVASLPMIAVQTGGLLMGQQMGLGFARFYNPGLDDEADIVGQVLFFMALAGFLAIGGHEAMVLAVLRSFDYIALGTFVVDLDVIALLTGLLLSAFELALRVAAPVLALVFLESVAMGYMAKTVPQLNILSLGFPLRILAGFAMVALGLFVINDVAMDGIDTVLDAIFEWVQSYEVIS
jgi:flagellar biosynthetic protein FliR